MGFHVGTPVRRSSMMNCILKCDGTGRSGSCVWSKFHLTRCNRHLFSFNCLVTTFSTIDGFNKAEAAIFPVQAMIFEDSLISQMTSIVVITLTVTCTDVYISIH